MSCRGATMKGGAPSSAFRFRSFDSAATGDGRLGFAVMRNVARLNETTTWPLLSKNASGFVSSFGDLTGVTIGTASKRLELVPYVVGEIGTDAAEMREPAAEQSGPRHRRSVST